MTIHTTVVQREEYANWDGKPGVRLDLRTRHNKNPKKTAADLHLYLPNDSPLAAAEIGSEVDIKAKRPGQP